jgi:protein-S-isoprenylcysteine O-methyltransferase Ste14
MEGEPAGSDQDRVTRIVTVITHGVIIPFTFLYSIFLPIQLGTWWLIAGLPVYLIGLLIVLMSSISFATEALSEPLSSGADAISRHPMYVGFFLAYAGIGIAGASWLFLLCAFVWIVSWRFAVDEEERILLEKSGEAYERYMDRTPRWIGFPKARNRQGLKPLG